MGTYDKNTILFSRTVKAGKRTYYIDVKQDRRGGHYLSITESKRVQEGTEIVPPVFEKHKVFLYSEDFEKFAQAFNEALSYVQTQEVQKPQQESQTSGLDGNEFRLDTEFE